MGCQTGQPNRPFPRGQRVFRPSPPADKLTLTIRILAMDPRLRNRDPQAPDKGFFYLIFGRGLDLGPAARLGVPSPEKGFVV